MRSGSSGRENANKQRERHEAMSRSLSEQLKAIFGEEVAEQMLSEDEGTAVPEEPKPPQRAELKAWIEALSILDKILADKENKGEK
tara:strand:+ start:3179 stop:3436 length:258 start_codon:yes stop_codon:yes gene_type:complete